MIYRFQNRSEAGVILAGKLKGYAEKPDVVVLGLPRGGVPVAYKVAEALSAPLDIFLVRKLGAPGHEEFAIGAIASGGVCFLSDKTIKWMEIPENYVKAIVDKEKEELARREHLYREDLPPVALEGKTVILVDDGLATGASMRAAVMAVRTFHPAKIIVAIPVAAIETCREFTKEVNEVVCVETPYPFFAVGEWYEEFGQVSDEEVKMLLRHGRPTPELSYETR